MRIKSRITESANRLNDSMPRVVELATVAEVLAGTNDTKATTPLSLAGLAASHGPNGYQTFPGGLILQWGSSAISNQLDLEITLPIAYPNNIWMVLAQTEIDLINEEDNNAGCAIIDLTKIQLHSGQVNRYIYWMTIGN